MLAGLDAALLLIGVWAPVTTDRLPEVHGILTTLGFVGALVCLERAVALAQPLGLLAPALLGAGSVLVLTPLPLAVGRVVLVLGMVGMCGVYVPLWRRQRDDAVLVQVLGAVLGLGAAIMWLGGLAIAPMLPWLAGFLILTIAGERLELARLGMGPGAGPIMVLLSLGLLVATVTSLLWPAAGSPLLGLALLSLTGWLLRHDVAWRTIHATGLTRFMAASMLAGYFWLLVAGGTWLLHGQAVADAAYDVVVHATFLGFTISMIMAHAPVILPAVLRRPLPYHRLMWVPLVLLHASLALRLWIGDALGVQTGWQVGGALNVVALLLFFGLVGWLLIAEGSRRTPLSVPARVA